MTQARRFMVTGCEFLEQLTIQKAREIITWDINPSLIMSLLYESVLFLIFCHLFPERLLTAATNITHLNTILNTKQRVAILWFITLWRYPHIRLSGLYSLEESASATLFLPSSRLDKPQARSSQAGRSPKLSPWSGPSPSLSSFTDPTPGALFRESLSCVCLPFQSVIFEILLFRVWPRPPTPGVHSLRTAVSFQEQCLVTLRLPACCPRPERG